MSTSFIKGYPLISGMSKQLFEWMAAYPNDMFRSSADFLVERFGTDPNIEDVITEIDSLIDSNMEDRLQHFTLVTARQQLFDSLREWFRELHLRPAFAYAKFADQVIHAGDVVITFNYDDSLERELRRAGKWDVSLGYGFPLRATPQPSPVTVLKLHGSTNWFASIFGGATSGDLLPCFRTKLSMISAKERGSGYVEEQAHRGADHRRVETTRSGT